ncbi:MAG TPA: hypothetical protein VFS18_02005, partial [Actinomycetota bacterium]|nr:hypothetical protein [Actinomycetota bacterium]
HSFRTYVTTGGVEGAIMRRGAPLLRALMGTPARSGIEMMLERRPEGPDDLEREQGYWTILAEARSGDEWRNVTLTGTDVYGLTAETLARAAIELSSDGYGRSGVLSPVQAVGVDVLVQELETWGVKVDTYAPA